MYVYGEITSASHWLFGSDSDVVTSNFVRDLRNHPNVRRINIYINSPGGEVFAAHAIGNQLKAHGAETHAYIDGLAASASVALALCADFVHMSNMSLMMIHPPSTGARGDAKMFAKAIEVLNKIQDTLVTIYKGKTGLSEEKLNELIEAETWMTADEALAYGFIDSITEGDPLDVQVNEAEEEYIVNGVSMAFSNLCSREDLEHKLAEYINKKGGSQPMNFEEFFNSLPVEQQALITQAMESSVETARNAWDTEKATMQQQIDQMAENTAHVDATEAASVEALATLPEEARTMILNAQKQAEEATAKWQAAEEATKFNNFKQTMAQYANLSMPEDAMQALYHTANAAPEQFGHIAEILKTANAAMETQFEETGTSQGMTATDSALEHIEAKIIQLRQKDDSLSYTEALNKVLQSDPALYNAYRSERS